MNSLQGSNSNNRNNMQQVTDTTAIRAIEH